MIAVDRLPQKLEWAQRLGARHVLQAGETDVRRSIKAITGGGVDVAIEAIGNPEVMSLAFECARPGGRLCVIGYHGGSVTLSAAKLMYREMEIVGSLGCRPVDYPRIIEMVRLGRLQVEPLVTHRFALEDIGAAFDVLRRGEGLRGVVMPGGVVETKTAAAAAAEAMA